MHTAQLMPLPLTVSCFSKIQTGFTILVLAHPDSRGQRAVKRVYVCRCVLDFMSETGSQVSWDEFSDSRCVSPALSCDFDISDTSWVDSADRSQPGSEVSTPEPPPSIWARFNSGISRFTLDLGGKTAAAGIPSIQVSDSPVLLFSTVYLNRTPNPLVNT